MNSNARKLLLLGATAAGLGAAAVGAYRATHPSDARYLDETDGGDGGAPPPDSLFDMPEDVIHHELATPDGGTIHAVERGRGRPLVLLHGVTLRHDIWAPQFRQMADRYRVIAVDLRGHGRSLAGTDGYGLPRLATDLATLLEALDLRDAVLVGHSMGGMTVMQFCGDHRDVLDERVAGLVFVATRAHQVLPPYVEGGARRLVKRGRGMVDAGRSLPASTQVSGRVVRLAFGDDPSPRAVEVVAEMVASMEPTALVGSIGGLLDHDARAALAATATPALVVVGTRDLLTPVPSGGHLAHLLPNGELVVLPRAGHQLMQERPEALAGLIDGFVAGLAGDADADADAEDTVARASSAAGAPPP